MKSDSGWLVVDVSNPAIPGRPLALTFAPNKPKEGVLDWRTDRPKALFDDQEQAQRAIDRTESFRTEANANLPAACNCHIVSAVKAQESER